MGDTMCIKGEFEINLYDRNRKLLKTYKNHNQITLAGRELMFNRGFATLFNCGTDLFGFTYSRDRFFGVVGQAGYHTDDTAITLGVLNLGEKRFGLNKSASALPIYTSGFTGEALDAVVGYASIKSTPDANGKEGYPVSGRGSSVAAQSSRELAWEFGLNVAGGSFDTLVLTGYNCLTNPAPQEGGIVNWKCIDKVNTKSAQFLNASSGFCPPGVTGLTSDSEILLNFGWGGITQWKYNINTGEVTEVKSGSPFLIPITVNVTDFYIEDNYLYTLTATGASNAAVTLTIYSLDTFTQVSTYSLPSSGATGRAYNRAKFFKYNEELYVSAASSNSTSTNTARCWKLTKGSAGYYNTAANGNSLLITAGIDTGLDDLYQVCIESYNGAYIVHSGNQGFICTDPNDIGGTMTGHIPFLNQQMVSFGSGTSAGFLSIGAPGGATAISTTSNAFPVNNYDSLKYVGGTQAANILNVTAQGVFLMREGHYGDMTSYVVLSSPMTKSDDQIMTVCYRYSFGSDTETTDF